MSDIEGSVTACPDCGMPIVMLEDGIVVDEDSEIEHECNPDADE